MTKYCLFVKKMSFGDISSRVADQLETELLNNLIGYIEKSDWNNVAEFVSKFGKMTNLIMQSGNNCFIYNPVCNAVIKSCDVSMIEFFLKDVVFDPSDDGLIFTAIRTKNLDVIRFVVNVVPTVEKWEMIECAKSTFDKNVIDLVEKLI